MELSDQSESISTGGKVKPEVLPQTPEDLLEDHSTSSSEKQLSIFSLTLGKIQSMSGRNFGSMNIDEFLNSIWSDEFQASSNVNEELATNEIGIEQTTLLCQRSLSVPIPLSGKTVDEVWAEIQQQNNHAQQNHRHAFRGFITDNESLHQLQTLGEMTLEEFLVKAGVMKESPNFPLQQGMLENLDSNPSGSYFSNGTCLDMNISIGQVMGYELSTPSSYVENGNTLTSKGSSVYHMFTLGSSGSMGEPSTIIGNGKCDSPLNAGETNSKRKTSASMEVAIERRQRRMIKNRESAQRSRARKQAYTAELEIELKQVRDENESLKFALEEATNKLKQKGSEHDLPGKKEFKTLRRTISSSW